MYRPQYYIRPIHQLFRGEFTANKKTRRKQDLERKTLTSAQPTRNQDAIEPELHILPAFVFLLLYQEHERRRRRPRVLHPAHGGLSSGGACGAHWPAVLVGGSVSVLMVVVSWAALLLLAVSWAVVLVAAVSAAVLLVAVSWAAVLMVGVSWAAVLVAVLSAVQVCGELPFFLCPFPTLDVGAAVFSLPTVVLGEGLVVPFLQEDGPEGGVVAAVEPVDSEDEEAEEEDIDNRNTVIHQYFQ
ncbi:hypothetical protein NDU88_002476 [Pleurodeles waltl]|uniref:Uncharacterized protein n=1 Tax=Pleurodeles waltl TaxID=8319 RepID=A0AAV7M0P1_PLEWA|nr:hypothetical protein NDU88_002476 [Pleurodeles waltl]